MKYLYLCVIYYVLFIYQANGDKPLSSHLSQNKEIGTFWQITDIHWDFDYSENGDEKNMCHKSSEVNNNSTGHFGNFYCDAPYALVQSTLLAMKNIEPNPDFIIWTGDNAPHTHNVTLPIIFKTLSNITEEMKSLFGTEIPILPVLGNHDTHPPNDFPASLESFYNDYLEKGNWKSLIPEDAHKDFTTGGYYKVEINSDIDVLVLNTNLYLRKNKLSEGLKDPSFQFEWLRNALGKAKSENRKVLVVAHIPPGYMERSPKTPFLSDSYNDEYVDILNEFGEQIIGQFYGHVHTDSFRIFGRSHDNFTSVGFIAPSVTPWYYPSVPSLTPVNPSIRLYNFSKNIITDYVQYHMNLTEANKSELIDACSHEGKNDLNCSDSSQRLWKQYYQATKAFGINSLDVTGLTEAFYKMSKNDTYFQAYYLLNSAGIKNGYCNETCKLDHLCSISHLKVLSVLNCLNSSQEYSSSVLDLIYVNDDSSNVEMLTYIFITIISTIILAVLILSFIIYRRKRNSSKRAIAENSDLTEHHNGYRVVDPEN